MSADGYFQAEEEFAVSLTRFTKRQFFEVNLYLSIYIGKNSKINHIFTHSHSGLPVHLVLHIFISDLRRKSIESVLILKYGFETISVISFKYLLSRFQAFARFSTK